MNELAKISEKRARLIAQAEAERRALAEEIAGASAGGLTMADRAFRLGVWLRARPYLVAAAIATIIMVRPGGTLRWGTRALGLWRLARIALDVALPYLNRRSAAPEWPKSAR
jgi:hypothetical protein